LAPSVGQRRVVLIGAAVGRPGVGPRLRRSRTWCRYAVGDQLQGQEMKTTTDNRSREISKRSNGTIRAQPIESARASTDREDANESQIQFDHHLPGQSPESLKIDFKLSQHSSPRRQKATVAVMGANSEVTRRRSNHNENEKNRWFIMALIAAILTFLVSLSRRTNEDMKTRGMAAG